VLLKSDLDVQRTRLRIHGHVVLFKILCKKAKHKKTWAEFSTLGTGGFLCCPFSFFISQTAKLKVENLARGTFRSFGTPPSLNALNFMTEIKCTETANCEEILGKLSRFLSIKKISLFTKSLQDFHYLAMMGGWTASPVPLKRFYRGM
jgi:hypothetical protein